MPISDLARIAEQTTHTRAVELWRRLQSLKSCVSFMNTGAHPDDETSAMLAALAYRDGVAISYACANRGEGGQNNIGSQNTLDLGVIRTAEMERAADVLGLRLYWLSEYPEDSIVDFGFSKSGVETLNRWGHERALQRFVHIIRSERPDIICTTFLDIPGQHGHHRAMTQLAQEVFDAAADENFKDVNLPTWQIKKLYLPAWSGAGDAYDDDLPPPPATVTIEGKGEEPISGWSYEQIGQHSRAFHLTQGMGRWVAPEDERNWPLHLARSCVGTSDENSISAGLPTTLASLADFADAASIQPLLQQADEEILTAIEAYPTLSKTRQAASKALSLVRQAQTECPADARNEVDHRLRQKESQLANVIRLATRAKIRPRLDSDVMHRGDVAALTIETEPGDSDALECSVTLPTGWQHKEGSVHILENATPRPCYPDRYLPDEPAAPALQVMLSVDGQTSQTFEALETPPLLLPKHSAQLSPSSVLLNTANSLNEFQIDIMNSNPVESVASLQLPDGWSAVPNKAGFNITMPADTNPGLYEIDLGLDDQPALTVNRFEFPHIKPRMRAYKASVQVCVLNMEIPAIRVGYIGGGNDRVAERLSEMGFNVEVLSDEKILNPDTYRELDTLVVGIFAVRMRPVLQQILPRIHEWVEAGGNLLTLYHRPWDDWNENTVPPRRLLIGKPSLRWRVTDEQATVNYLLPKHPLLNTPNIIDADDWLGWHKERGLYFAAEWDAAYEALLSMSDPDEQPLTGSLVSARIGEGRHTHTSLILHHQMEQLVTGAYRLMANLVVGAR